MLKIFVVALAVSVFNVVGQGVVDENETDDRQPLTIEQINDELWRQKCIKESGTEIDFERHNRLFQQYEMCRNETLDVRLFAKDIYVMLNNLSPQNYTIEHWKKLHLVRVAQTNCPKVRSFYKCKETIAPILEECYNVQEIKGIHLNDEISMRVNDFFCENNSERVQRYIDGNVLECAFAHEVELMTCFEQYRITMYRRTDVVPMFSNIPRADIFCRAIEVLKTCAISILEQCELSQNAGELFKAFYKYVDTETLCADEVDELVT